ncbi:MAG: hypothetical protein ACI8RZ_004239, partial [Myxococcota bacterium]
MKSASSLLTALLLACTPATTSAPISEDTAADTTPSPDSGNTVVVVAEDTGVEGVTTTEAMPVFSPDGGAFVSEVTVTLAASGGIGQVRYCLDEPDSTCTLQDYTGPVTVSASAMLYARVESDTAVGEVIARSFVEVTEGVAA